MKKKILQNLWWITFILSITLLGVHTFKLSNISVDSTSVLLLIISLISPFVISIRKIKFGDFEAEIDAAEVQKLKSDVEKITKETEAEFIDKPEIYIATESIRELALTDPIIALAKVRIELEKVLSKLARVSDIELKTSNLGVVVKALSNYEIISLKIGKSLTEVIAICNRAIHGENISEENADTIVSVGVDLLEEIYWLIQEQIVSGSIISEEIITNEDVDRYYNSKKYRLTSITPLVENPRKTVRELTQEQLDEILDGYPEYAEFIVELVEISES